MEKKAKTFVEYCKELSIEERTTLSAELSNLCFVGFTSTQHWMTGYRSPRWRMKPVITPYLNNRGMEGTFEELFPDKKPPKRGISTI
jgi:hypothetical protein